jgi:hypothetical protein
LVKKAQVPEQVDYDDVANLRKSSSSSSSSSEVVIRNKKESIDKDREEARMSFQAAPEKYRKESSYLDLDGSGEPKVKEQIEIMLDRFGKDETIKESSTSSSSSNAGDKEEAQDEMSAAPAAYHMRFQRRKSSYSSGSELDPNFGHNEVFSFVDNAGVSIDDIDGPASGTSDSESSNSSKSAGSFIIEQDEIVRPKIGKKPIINVDRQSSGYGSAHLVHQPVNAKKESSSDSSESSEVSSDDEKDSRPVNPMVRDSQFVNNKPSLSNGRPVMPTLQHASNNIDEGYEIQLCTPAVIRADDDSTSSEESSGDDSSTEEEEPEYNNVEPVILPRVTPKVYKDQRNAKSLSLESGTRPIKRIRSSSTSSVSSSNSSPTLIDTMPGGRKLTGSKSSDPMTTKFSDPLSNSFLKNLNKSYQPVYVLRKINSTTQTEAARSQSTEQW